MREKCGEEDTQVSARKLVSLLTPLLLHQTVALAVAFVLRLCADQYGLPYDAALVVLIGNLLVLPIAAWMHWRDSRRAVLSETGRSEKEAVSGRRAVPGMQSLPERKDCESEADTRSRLTRRQVLFGAICFIGGGALNIAWSSVLNLLQLQEHFSNQVQEQLLATSLLLQIVGLGIAAPIAEELIFRGLTYRRMRQFFPVWMSAVLSALLFAVYHGNPIQMIFAFPLAIVLALIYEHGKLFIFPVLFHMGSNLTAIFLQILLR